MAGELIPRLLESHRVGPVSPSVERAAERAVDREDVGPLVGALLEGNDEEVRSRIDGLREEGAAAESIYLDLLAPAARRLGELWDRDECHFAEVAIALGRMQYSLRRLSGEFRREGARSETLGDALFCSEATEQHSFGVLMLSEFFLRAGWGVDVGELYGVDEARERVAERPYDLVGISVACDVPTDRLRGLVERLRRDSLRPGLRVMVGGPSCLRRPELAERAGADATARDALEAVRVAEGLLSE